jgi:hypothetical protein
VRLTEAELCMGLCDTTKGNEIRSMTTDNELVLITAISLY